MNNTIMTDIICPGSEVEMVQGDVKISVRIITVSVSGHWQGVLSARYEVAWLVGSDRKTAWIEPHEMQLLDSGRYRKIGFGYIPQE